MDLQHLPRASAIGRVIAVITAFRSLLQAKILGRARPWRFRQIARDEDVSNSYHTPQLWIGPVFSDRTSICFCARNRSASEVTMNAEIIDQWRAAPRLHNFADFFEQTAGGVANQPDIDLPEADLDLLGQDLACLSFGDTHRKLWGAFDNHYFASIPFRLEEECRLGAAILRFGLRAWASETRPATVYTLGAGAGTLSRALARLGDGRFRTLNCSPTVANRASFFAKRGSGYAHFHHGPFFELDEDRYASDDNLAPFRDGFDVLFEDTTFQMYGRDRANQTAFVAPRVRDQGLLIQVQKIRHPSDAVYQSRERMKDRQFKSRFFSKGQIADKRTGVLNTMDTLQVDLDTSIAALAAYFTYTLVTWSSGNFYTLISSRSARAMRDFVTSLIAPAIPAEFCHEHLPLGFDRGEPFKITAGWDWRQYDHAVSARQSQASPHLADTVSAGTTL
jgi:tRNA (cmo5U34)-methyltransferase